MKSKRFFDSRVGYLIASVGTLFGVAAPAVVPALASAATVTSYSVAMSTASEGATANYTVSFTPASAVGDLVVDWCTTPALGTACATPTGFDASGVGVGDHTGWTGTLATTDSTTTHTIVAGGTHTAGATTLELTGITNPSVTTPFYARLYTYAGTSDYSADYSTDNDPGTVVDSGSIALVASQDIGVSASVLESMSFCVSHAAPTANCEVTTPPSLSLGEGTGDLQALNSDTVSTGTDYAQLSTNSTSGAVVSLKSSAAGCGGLLLNGTTCGIGPATASDDDHTLTLGKALFGVQLGDPEDPTSTTHTGTLVPSGSYNTTGYYMGYAGDDGSGVTGPYGDPILNTDNLPASNVNVPLTFGASANNTTPAGKYSATLSLIATGKF